MVAKPEPESVIVLPPSEAAVVEPRFQVTVPVAPLDGAEAGVGVAELPT
jgi:hypothetical protein